MLTVSIVGCKVYQNDFNYLSFKCIEVGQVQEKCLDSFYSHKCFRHFLNFLFITKHDPQSTRLKSTWKNTNPTRLSFKIIFAYYFILSCNSRQISPKSLANTVLLVQLLTFIPGATKNYSLDGSLRQPSQQISVCKILAQKRIQYSTICLEHPILCAVKLTELCFY